MIYASVTLFGLLALQKKSHEAKPQQAKFETNEGLEVLHRTMGARPGLLEKIKIKKEANIRNIKSKKNAAIKKYSSTLNTRGSLKNIPACLNVSLYGNVVATHPSTPENKSWCHPCNELHHSS
jgi:hypothetical protein